MKTSKFLRVGCLALCAALLAACESPESRIKNSPEAYARLNPDQQELVRKGQIAVGFDMEAVRLALGDPTRIVTRTTAAGQHEVWHYVTYEDSQGVIIYGGYYHRWRGWAGGPYFYGGMPYYDGYPARVHDRLRVEFDSNGRVASIEQEKS